MPAGRGWESLRRGMWRSGCVTTRAQPRWHVQSGARPRGLSAALPRGPKGPKAVSGVWACGGAAPFESGLPGFCPHLSTSAPCQLGADVCCCLEAAWLFLCRTWGWACPSVPFPYLSGSPRWPPCVHRRERRVLASCESQAGPRELSEPLRTLVSVQTMRVPGSSRAGERTVPCVPHGPGNEWATTVRKQ